MTYIEGVLKAPFSMATTPRCKGGRYSIPSFKFLRDIFLLSLERLVTVSVFNSTSWLGILSLEVDFIDSLPIYKFLKNADFIDLK